MPAKNMFGEVVIDIKLAIVAIAAFGYCVYKCTSISVKKQFLLVQNSQPSKSDNWIDESNANCMDESNDKQADQSNNKRMDHSDDLDDKNLKMPDHLLHENQKLVIAVRTDLHMGKGKAAAQCCHAAIGAYIAAKKEPKILNAWDRCGQAKVTVKVDSEAALLAISKHAKSLGLLTYIVQDAGRTQILAGSKTVCAVGPGPAYLIDLVTGDLKLY